MIINLDKLFYRIIFTFPLTTLFQSYFEGINKVIFGLLIFLLLLKYRKVRKSIILVVIILSIVYVFTIYKTGTIPYISYNFFFYSFFIYNRMGRSTIFRVILPEYLEVSSNLYFHTYIFYYWNNIL